MDVEISEDTYKGNQLLVITNVDDDRYPFSFGLTKARLLQAALEQDPDCIKRFIQEHKK